MQLESMGRAAREASYQLAQLGVAQKDQVILAIADGLDAQQAEILSANAEDIAQARSNGLTDAMIDRLLLTPERLEAIAADARNVATLPDPVGREFNGQLLENGMRLTQRAIPLGVIGVIYEARPNVTIDIATLCLKTGNAAILRGGKETIHSNRALVKVIQQALASCQLSPDCVQFIDSPDRSLVTELLTMDHYVDMIIPRGGTGLQQLCREKASIPVITGGIGICHLFVDQSADQTKAVSIIENAKVQRPSVCNALDTVLVHEAIAAEFLPKLARQLAESKVELRAEPLAHQLLAAVDTGVNLQPAGEQDFDQEWLALILGVKVVADVQQAIEHVRAHSSEHSDGILTQDMTNATEFVNAINSAAVYVNASTRFTDGSQFALGAEVAVSTQKLHARGPMGLAALTTYKWVIEGDGHIRT